jgi:ComF family protein
VVVDAVLPPLCLSCRAVVAEPGTLCPACWSEVDFLTPPACACCFEPFEADVGEGALCGSCVQRQPRFRRARAVFRYDDATRSMILRLKHGDRLEGVPAFARWMARAGGEMLAEADLIVPVPLHWWRLAMRRYNQAALLAMALGKLSKVSVVPDLMLRRRRTPPQGHLSREARLRNVAGAFSVREGAKAKLEGKTVLLIDDVLTTGATVNECAKVLRRAGAAQVDVLTLGRVVRD